MSNVNSFKKKQIEKKYEEFYGKYWEALANQQNKKTIGGN